MRTALYLALIAIGQANPVGGLYNESSSNFLRDFGFPMFVAVGLFALFGSLMWAMTSRFFKNMEASNVERKEITTQFTGVLENALQNNTTQLTIANESLRQSCDAIASLATASTQQHSSITESIKECKAKLEVLDTTVKSAHNRVLGKKENG